MPTYTDQLNNVNATTDSLVYENTTRAITGALHNQQEIAQNVSAFANLVAYDNYAYKVVRTYATDAENGQSLRDAYADAITQTPGGNPLSATNRFALLIPPGTYALGSTGLTLDTQFVDLIGLGRADETVITSVSNTNGGNGTIIQTTNDIKFRNLTIQNDAAAYSTGTDTDDSGYAPQGVFPTTEFTDCIFRNPGTGGDGAPFMRLGVEYGGTYQRCRGIDSGSGISVFFAIASGNYFDCHTSVNGFGYLGEASGIFTDSSCLDGFGFGADATGSFTRCTAFNSGFGSGGNASGTFNQCTALTNSFGWGFGVTCSGTFSYCTGTDYCFGESTSAAIFIGCRGNNFCYGGDNATATLAGTYTDCIAANDGFGCAASNNTLSGSFYGCVVTGANGFCGSTSADLSGTFVGCKVSSTGFGSSGTLNGEFVDCWCGEYGFGWSGAVTVNGSFTNCVSGVSSFNIAYNGTCNGVYKGCRAGDQSFGFVQSQPATLGTWTMTYNPIMVGCFGGSECFGALNNLDRTSILVSGTFTDCHAVDSSFGYTPGNNASVSFTGKAYNCTAGNYSFCTTNDSPVAGTHTEVMSGYLENCHAGPGSFAAAPTATKTGTLSGCTVRAIGLTPSITDAGVLTGTMINCQWTSSPAGDPALLVATGAKVYGGLYRAGAGATAGISSSGAATVSIANILTNVALAGTITNNITSPNVIVDSDI
jgi:hypothetical protein